MKEVKAILPKSQSFKKRIGSSCYEVTVHFSDTSKENITDKIHRLIRNEVIDSKVVV